MTGALASEHLTMPVIDLLLKLDLVEQGKPLPPSAEDQAFIDETDNSYIWADIRTGVHIVKDERRALALPERLQDE